MEASDARAGLVLAGGPSTRFGDREKALAELDGRPLLAHTVDRLGDVVDGVLVNCRDEQVPAFRPVLSSVSADVAVAPDPIPGRGPAAGLASGLSPLSASHVAVVACDTPFVDASFVDHLFDRAADRDGAVPRIDDHLQPTHAVYRRGPSRRAARESVVSGDRSLHDVVDRLDVTVVSETDVLSRTTRRSFTDVNTPTELRAVERGR